MNMGRQMLQLAQGVGGNGHIVAKYDRNGKLQKLYDADKIGERRLQELNLRRGANIGFDIDVAELGRYSATNTSVIVALVNHTPNQTWVLLADTIENRRQVWGHAYIVKGKKIRPLMGSTYGTLEQRMQRFEAEEGSMEQGRALFRAGMGQSIRKKTSVKKGAHFTKSGVSTTARPTAQGDVCSAGGMAIMVKRFSNSRLTCVYKTRNV